MNDPVSGGDQEVSRKNVIPSNKTIHDLRIPRKFVNVPGYDERHNDLVYCSPLEPSQATEMLAGSVSSPTGPEERREKLVVFFGGDIQDFPEIMKRHKVTSDYFPWNLEATALILQKQFPRHHIVVIRPKEIDNQILTSYFDNFVYHCNCIGGPQLVMTHGSLEHLEMLLTNLSQLIVGIQDENLIQLEDFDTPKTTPRTKNPRLHRSRISLVGFNKGSVVLNQLLYELHYLKTLTPDDTTMDAFVGSIKDMSWLDGGHDGKKNTWVTSRSILETLFRHQIRVHVHTIPYRITDETHPWIRKEEQLFCNWLTRFNGPIKRYVHFQNERSSPLQHFRLIEEFGTAEKAIEPQCPKC